jgi:hypothetical protein
LIGWAAGFGLRFTSFGFKDDEQMTVDETSGATATVKRNLINKKNGFR